MNYKVNGRVYRVKEDENAYEYHVQLLNGDELIDEWFSITECFSVHHDHLSHEKAVATVQEITNDVHEGCASTWFDLE